MKILGIETSCDETAASVVENGTKLLSQALSSSIEIHKKTGGIIPEKAARQQVQFIIPVIKEALFKAATISGQSKRKKFSSIGWAKGNIDAIAVTAGQGLIGSLLVGVEAAKTLAWVWNKPIIPAVHTLAHIYANWLAGPPYPKFPALVLTASGGHTILLLMREHSDFQQLGETRDDTAGEAFDKIARSIGLSFPGGPAIEKSALGGNPTKIHLPRPLINSGDFDFSFSGLKTAVVRTVQTGEFNKSDLAAATQEAICDVLVKKTLYALVATGAESLLLAGGVAANRRLREQFKEKSPVTTHIPPIEFCTDNAAMVASFAYFNYYPLPWEKIQAEANIHTATQMYAKNPNRSK